MESRAAVHNIDSGCRASQAARRLRLMGTALAALALLAPIQPARTAEVAGMAVTVVRARPACFEDNLKLSGFVVARDETLVHPDVEGYRVAKILVEDGDTVTAGEKLADLVKPDWLPQGLPATASLSANAAGILVIPRPVPIGVPVSARADPLFRIIKNGEFDVVLDVPQTLLTKIKPGQSVRIETLGAADLAGTVRNLSPEIDFLSQQGHAWVQVTGTPNLRPGSFAGATVDIGRSCSMSVPLSAVLFDTAGSEVLVVADDRVEVRPVRIGLLTGNDIEIRSGLKTGDVVVQRAGAFLHEHDPVRPILVEAREPAP